jgi:hypothetical protein
MLVLRWRRLLDEKGLTCPRCGTTEAELEKAYKVLEDVCRALGLEVELIKEAIKPEDFKKDPLRSNEIWINERPLEEWLGAKTESSLCCDVCGDNECRTVVIGSETYESIPSGLILKAALMALAEILPVSPKTESPGLKILNRCSC